MLINRLIGTLAALIVGTTAAYAQTVAAPTNADECAQLVEDTEISVEEVALDNDGANELLLALDEACAKADFAKAADIATELGELSKS